jgi:predicted short-subunit dehydrogenase-like oxidoreductase (DUF2520 family)
LSGIGIIGPGRAGVGLELALTDAGHEVWLHGRRGKDVPPPLRLSWGGMPDWLARADVVVLAVRDGTIASVARELAGTQALGGRHVVLHLSGMLGIEPLLALRPSGAALGVLHPLQAIARPESAPARLRGALAAITGDAPAVAAAERLARDIGLRPVRLAAPAKPLYHAAAAIASNYLVVLADLTERLLTDAGLSPDDARTGLVALMRGTLDNVAAEGARALTGPIVRGDVETVAAHLAALPPDVAAVYRVLGREALRSATLDPATTARMREILERGIGA